MQQWYKWIEVFGLCRSAVCQPVTDSLPLFTVHEVFPYGTLVFDAKHAVFPSTLYTSS